MANRSSSGKSAVRAAVLACAMACLCVTASVSAKAAPPRGATLGGAGHYLMARTRTHFNNPTGKAFSLWLHRFQWWIGGGWNRPDLKVRLTAPDGKVVVDKTCRVGDDGYRIDVPRGAKGAYTLDVDPHTTLNFWTVRSTLPGAVAWTGPNTGDAVKSRWFMAAPFVPRKWYFWVPAGTKKFILRAQNNRGRSHREDHGLTIFSPRGQRMAVLWGQANQDAPEVALGKVKRRIQRADVIVEAGSAGRFWAIEIRHGESHTYSDINISLEGVPPYLSRSPEEWFDPSTGKPAPVSPYDDAEFVQSDVTKGSKRKGDVYHWTPCPALGDPDANELRCPTKIALWNPQGRELKFCIATYLPRNMFPGKDPKTGRVKKFTDADYDQADVKITDHTGRALLSKRVPLKHQHGHGPGSVHRLRTKAVATIDVTGAEHFWCYTYPATPAVLVGQKTDDGWRRFLFEIGTARNWYFFVPRGTRSFQVRAAAGHKTDVMKLEVNAPDRVIAMIYDNKGAKTVRVPAGLDGKIWHVRIDFGGATRFVSRLPRPRFPSLDVTLDLKGVPGYLAPTWEQWFDPAKPVPAVRRGEKSRPSW